MAAEPQDHSHCSFGATSEESLYGDISGRGIRWERAVVRIETCDVCMLQSIPVDVVPLSLERVSTKKRSAT